MLYHGVVTSTTRKGNYMKKKLLMLFCCVGVQHARCRPLPSFGISHITDPMLTRQFVTADAGSPYLVTGISGFANGLLIEFLTNYAGANNLFYSPATPSFLDFAGISFQTVGGLDWNIFYDGANWALRSDQNPVGYPDGLHPITLQVTQVPEPASLALLGLGLAGLAFARLENSNSILFKQPRSGGVFLF